MELCYVRALFHIFRFKQTSNPHRIRLCMCHKIMKIEFSELFSDHLVEEGDAASEDRNAVGDHGNHSASGSTNS